MIPYGHQEINQADIKAVEEILRSDFLTQGPAVPAFEQAVSAYCGSQYAVAVNSATSALHVACLALDLGPSDWLWTSPNTFVASANAGVYCGAHVDFVDIDPRTYNMSVARLAEKLEQAKTANKLPKIVMPVHFAGQSCEMTAIHALSQQYGFRIIEDASHAIGGKYQDQPIGDCCHSDVTVFSFHPVKIITTGEGGMALTNSQPLADKMTLLRSHGITRDPARMTQAPDGDWYYQQVDLGFNYRMTDVQAALGISQIRRLEEFVKRRHVIAQRYNEAFSDLSVVTPWQHPDVWSSYHLYPIRIAKSLCSKTQRQVYDALRNAGVGVNLHYIPVYRQPYYEARGFSVGYCPQAERYYKETISLPIFPGLTEADQDRVINVIRKTLL